MSKVSIILVDWDGYALKRKKNLGENIIHCGLKRLLDLINSYDAGVDFDIHLIINMNNKKKLSNDMNIFSKIKKILLPSKKTYNSLKCKYPFIKEIYYRDNQGMDIGAYNFGLDILRKNEFDGDVLFMNSSVIGARRSGWLKDYQLLFNEEENTGLCGISMNSHNTLSSEKVFMPHVQSFFLYTNMLVLKKVFPNGLPASDVTLDKHKLILDGEIGISTKILHANYGIRCSAFKYFNYRLGDDWIIPEGDLRFSKKYKDLVNQI